MIAGHAPLAFAIAAGFAAVLGVERRRALTFGVLAGAFAVVPDVDVVYAAVGGLGALTSGLWVANEAFWDHASVVHRGITHSLAIGVIATGGFGLLASDTDVVRGTAGLVLLGLLALAAGVAGGLGLAMMALFLAAGGIVVLLARRWGFGARATLASVVIGLLTHPFGDLFTGTPPALLYPLDVTLLTERVALHSDPTANLLAVFALELAAIWLGVLVAGALLDIRIRTFVDRPAIAGSAYGLAVLVLPAPTLDVSYPFVFSAVATGIVGVPTLRHRVNPEQVARGFLTGLAAITLALCSYAVGYAVF